MGHRSKHLRRNWVPGRREAAEARAKIEDKRQEEAMMRRIDAEVAAMAEAEHAD